jgi:GTPase SAR1 family protein
MVAAVSLDAIKQFLELLPLAKGIVPAITWIVKNLVAFITILLIIIVAIVVFLGSEFFLSSQQFPGLTLISMLFAIFVGACTLLAALVFFPPVKAAFQQIGLPATNSPKPLPNGEHADFNLVLYGLRGSGKTTLIKKLLTLEELGLEPSTLDAKVYTGQVKFDLSSDRTLNLRIADYYGEKPSNFLEMIKSEFVDGQGVAIVNAIIFFVDIAPRGIDLDGSLMSDEKLISAMDRGKIDDRIAEHHDYISRSILEVLFSQIASANLHSVRLLINKADLAEEFYRKNGFKRQFANPEAWARAAFDRIDTSLHQACQTQGLDYAAYFTSLTKNPNIDFLKGLKGM